MATRRRNLTAADKEAARRLRAIWDATAPRRMEEGRPLTQEVMAGRLAIVGGRGTQGAVSQYLNGHIALNYRALLAFADELGFDPADVRKDLPEQQLQDSVHRRDDPTADRASDLEMAEIRAVVGLVAQALASTIRPAGEELLSALESLPPTLRGGHFVRDAVDAVRRQMPARPARHAPKRDAQKDR